MTLDDLVGTHTISAIWRGHMKMPDAYSGEAMIVLLRIDDRIYWFQEDPGDGYRSSMREIRRATNDDLRLCLGDSHMSSFEPIVVELRKRPNDHSSNDVLYAINERTNLVILEIGTRNVDDYYPVFEFQWTPEGYTPDWFEAKEEDDEKWGKNRA